MVPGISAMLLSTTVLDMMLTIGPCEARQALRFFNKEPVLLCLIFRTWSLSGQMSSDVLQPRAVLLGLLEDPELVIELPNF